MSGSKEKNKLLLGGVVVVLVAATLGVYFFTASSDGLTYGDTALIILPLILVIGFGAFILKRHKEAKGGVLEDERSRNIMNISLARAYLLSIYWLLGMGFFSEELGLESFAAHTITGLGILGMAILFAISYVYTSRFDASIEG